MAIRRTVPIWSLLPPEHQLHLWGGNYYYTHFDQRCRTQRSFYPYTYEQHLVYKTGCTGYVECYKPWSW